jgi:hypothetical protein
VRLAARTTAWVAAALALVVCLGWVTGRTRDVVGTTYSVSALRMALERHPDAWIGRTVTVRGVVPVALPVYLCAPDQDPCPDVAAAYLLADPPRGVAPTGSAPIPISIPLVLGQPDPTLAMFRDIPEIGHFILAMEILLAKRVATYRVRVENAPASSPRCRVSPCPIFQLVDAAPSLRREGR